MKEIIKDNVAVNLCVYRGAAGSGKTKTVLNDAVTEALSSKKVYYLDINDNNFNWVCEYVRSIFPDYIVDERKNIIVGERKLMHGYFTVNELFNIIEHCEKLNNTKFDIVIVDGLDFVRIKNDGEYSPFEKTKVYTEIGHKAGRKNMVVWGTEQLHPIQNNDTISSENIEKTDEMVKEVMSKLIGADIKPIKPSEETTIKFTDKKIHIPFWKKFYWKVNKALWNMKTNSNSHKENDVLFKCDVSDDLEERLQCKFVYARGRKNSVTVYVNGDIIINNLGPLCGEEVLYTNKGKRFILTLS